MTMEGLLLSGDGRMFWKVMTQDVSWRKKARCDSFPTGLGRRVGFFRKKNGLSLVLLQNRQTPEAERETGSRSGSHFFLLLPPDVVAPKYWSEGNGIYYVEGKHSISSMVQEEGKCSAGEGKWFTVVECLPRADWYRCWVDVCSAPIRWIDLLEVKVRLF